MPMWIWIVIGLGAFLGPSLVAAFAVARVLGTIGLQISKMYETEGWATLPPTRASKDVKEQQPDEVGVSLSARSLARR
jgi:hypothetical protein